MTRDFAPFIEDTQLKMLDGLHSPPASKVFGSRQPNYIKEQLQENLQDSLID